MAAEPFIGLRPASALRRLTDELCHQAGFRPQVIPATDLFRRHVIRRAAAGRLPAVSE